MKAPAKVLGKHRIMNEINMIPFIDVALVLLIIFMVMTPFLVRSQLKINLPSTKKVEPDLTRKQTLTVQVDRAGTAYLNGLPVAPDLLEGRLKQLLTDPERQPVVVEADKDVPFQHVVAVMDAAKRIGATKLAVCVKKQGQK
ncbi:MAG: biopolymer transporter ExbD [bacterium]